jgi:lambda repressor-like predicted transcriptional regulator
MGRKPATGRFETHEELVARVWQFEDNGGMSMAEISRNCEVSPTTVKNILAAGRPDDEPVMGNQFPDDYTPDDPAEKA